MVDLIDELHEDLKHERMMAFWRKTGSYMMVASFIIVGATVGMVWWQQHQDKKQQAASGAYLTAVTLLDNKEWEAGAKAMAKVEEVQVEGMTTLARLQEARALTIAGKPKEALSLYEKIIGDAKADAALKTSARLYAAQLQLQEKGGFDAVKALLSPVADDAKNNFQPFAKELLAYAALESGKQEEARKLLEEARLSENVPVALKERVEAVLASLPVAADAAPAAKP